MKSDIILNDQKVEIIGSQLTVKGGLLIEDMQGEQLLRLNSAYMALGNRKRNIFRIQVESKDKVTKISSAHVISDYLYGEKMRTRNMGAEKLNANEIEVGPTNAEGPRTSKITLNNKHGDPTILVDGGKGEVKTKDLLVGYPKSGSLMVGPKLKLDPSILSPRMYPSKITLSKFEPPKVGTIIRSKESSGSMKESPQPGNIKVINKHGEVAITIDGENEDILLKSIGSLTQKIRELEQKIEELS